MWSAAKRRLQSVDELAPRLPDRERDLSSAEDALPTRPDGRAIPVSMIATLHGVTSNTSLDMRRSKETATWEPPAAL